MTQNRVQFSLKVVRSKVMPSDKLSAKNNRGQLLHDSPTIVSDAIVRWDYQINQNQIDRFATWRLTTRALGRQT